MIGLPQPVAAADATTPTVATEADQGSRKKRKRSAASPAGTPPSRRHAEAPVTCRSRVTQDLQTAVSLLFSACRPPLRTPDLPAAPDAEQAPTMDDLLRICHADSTTASDDGRAAADLPRDVIMRLIRYLEAVATTSSRRGKPPQMGPAGAADPDSPLTLHKSSDPEGAFSFDAAIGAANLAHILQVVVHMVQHD